MVVCLKNLPIPDRGGAVEETTEDDTLTIQTKGCSVDVTQNTPRLKYMEIVNCWSAAVLKPPQCLQEQV